MITRKAKSNIKAVFVGSALFCFSGMSFANQWVSNATISQLGTYQHDAGHFVWLSTGVVAECLNRVPGNPTLYFRDDRPGGKSMMATLTTALVANRRVDVQVNGCDIVEVYLK